MLLKYSVILSLLLFTIQLGFSQAPVGQWGNCEFETKAEMDAFSPSTNWDCKKAYVQADSSHYQWDGQNWILPKTDTPDLYIYAAGKVNANGSADTVRFATTSRISTGTYQVTFDTPMADATYVITLSLLRYIDPTIENQNINDDPNIVYFDQQSTGFKVQVSDGDNGSTNGPVRNHQFHFAVIKL